MADDLARNVPDQDELLAALERENRKGVWLPMLLLIVLPLLGAAAIWRFGLTRSEVLEAKVEEEVKSEDGRRAISSAVAEQLSTPLGTRAIRGGVADQLLENPELRRGFEVELSREITGSEALRGALRKSIETELADSERLADALADGVASALDRPELRARLRALASEELRGEIRGDAVRELFESRIVDELRASDEIAGAVRGLAKKEVDGLVRDDEVIRELADEIARSETFRRSLSGITGQLRQLETRVEGMASPAAEPPAAQEAARLRDLRAELEGRLAALEANAYRSLPLREGKAQELPALGLEVIPGELIRDQSGAKVLAGFAIVPRGGERVRDIPERLPLDAWHDFAWKECVYRFRVSEVSKPILRDARLNLEINRTCDNGG